MMTNICIYYLFNGEIEHLNKSLNITRKISSDIFIFCSENHRVLLKDFNQYNIKTLNFNNHFGDLRNEALNYIKNNFPQFEWCIQLDSDECFDSKTFWQIIPYIEMYGKNMDGFELKIINNGQYWLVDEEYLPIKEECRRNLKSLDIRIFRICDRIFYKGRTEEKLNIAPYLTKNLNIKIFHHAYRGSDEESLNLSNRQKKLKNWTFLDEEDKRNISFEVSKEIIPIHNEKPVIGFFCLHYIPPIGGAELSMHSYFKELSKDYDIRVNCFLNTDGKPFHNNSQEKKDGIIINKLNANPIGNPKTITDCVHKFINENKPDLIITQLLQSQYVILAAKNFDVPCMYFVHGLFEDICPHHLLSSCEHNDLEICHFSESCANSANQKINSVKYQMCDSIICNSFYSKRLMERFHPEVAEKIKIVCPQSDYDLFEFKPSKKNSKKVLAINSMIPKGRDIVINLAKRNPDLEFIYLNWKDNINTPSNIRKVSKVSHLEMSRYYQEADVVLIPTLMRETFCRTACEAILSGTPVVCSNFGNLPNLVTHEENGLIVNEIGNIEEWHRNLRSAITMKVNEECRNNLIFELNMEKNLNILKKEINSLIKIEENYATKIEIKELEKEKEEGRKILFVGKYGHPGLGGGEIFIYDVFEYLKSKGYICEVACYFDGRNDTPFKNRKNLKFRDIYTIQFPLRTIRDFDDIIKERKPDLVLTQSFEASEIIEAAKRYGCKTILGTHFWRNICSVSDVFNNMLTRSEETYSLLTRNQRCFDLADKCYVNSKFMQDGVERYVGKKIDNIINPMINKKRIEFENHNPKYITLINPDNYKGGNIFIKIAKKLPAYNFMCVGQANPITLENKHINNNLSTAHNIRCISKTENMSEIYSQTKILLVPSIVDETFSLVTLEAIWNGIPVIVSNNGNLPNIVGSDGIVLNCENIDDWVEAIKMLCENEEYYQEFSNLMRKKSREFDPESQLDKFKKMVEDCFSDKG